MRASLAYLERSWLTSIYRGIKVSRERKSISNFLAVLSSTGSPIGFDSVPFVRHASGCGGAPYYMWGVINELVGIINDFVAGDARYGSCVMGLDMIRWDSVMTMFDVLLPDWHPCFWIQ